MFKPISSPLTQSILYIWGELTTPNWQLLFSATTGVIFVAIVAWSPPVYEPLHATFRMKIAPVLAENVVGWKVWSKYVGKLVKMFEIENYEMKLSFYLSRQTK